MSTKKKKKEENWFVLLILFSFPGDSCSILSGTDAYTDITSDYKYGCQWHGGSMGATLSCTCHSDLQEFLIQQNSIPSYDTVTIDINSCNILRFGSNAISSMRNLRNIHLSNIKSLYFEDSSFFWDGYTQNTDYYQQGEMNIPGLKIMVKNSTVSQISSYTFKGRINEIIFEKVIIENMAAFGFSSLLETQRIQFTNTQFKNIQVQAFKKFDTKHLTITGSEFGLLPSRAFSDINVAEHLLIKDSSFHTVKPAAFLVQNPRHFEFSNSRVKVLEGEGFKITTRGSVTFKNNNFSSVHDGAFSGIHLNREDIYDEQNILFESDIFNSLSRGSLRVNSESFNVKFINILLNTTCDCKFLHFYRIKFYEEILCVHNNVQKVTLKYFKQNNCLIVSSYATVTIIIGVLSTLFIIIATVLAIYLRKVYKKKQSKSISGKNGKQSFGLIVPDGRTYRETELHVIVERADLLTTDL